MFGPFLLLNYATANIQRHEFFALQIKSNAMKGARNENNMQSKQNKVNLPKPEIRDNLDSRKEKEAGFVDHNNSSDKTKKNKKRER